MHKDGDSMWRGRTDIFESPLRYSTRILNSELIRNSFSRQVHSPINLRSTNLDRYRSHYQRNAYSRSPTRRSESPDSMGGDPINKTYLNLRGTLSKLQNKIQKAKQILDCKRAPRHDRLHVFEDMESISQIESETTKKNDPLSIDQSTKLLSLTKNESSISLRKKFKRKHSPCRSKPISSFMRANNLYYVSSVLSLCSKENSDARIEEHITASFEVLKNLHQIEAPEFGMIEEHRSNLPTSAGNKGKKTLLIDIDETILHCEEDPNPLHKYDFHIRLQLTDGQAHACINLRPYALSFLKSMANLFEIIVFTASHQSYIDPVLNEIDPDGEIFSHRLYRKHCHQIAEGVYTKDLRMVNRKPESMILLDNSPYSYIFQLQNAIPILPYYGGADTELPKLEKYLKVLSLSEDVREINKATFKLHRYNEFDDLNQMIDQLYSRQQ